MSKNLTKNARWVILWVRSVNESVPMALPQEITLNCGRWPWSVPTMQAINETLDFRGDKILASKVYEVDVRLFPYAKQFKEVTALAERNMGILQKGKK